MHLFSYNSGQGENEAVRKVVQLARIAIDLGWPIRVSRNQPSSQRVDYVFWCCDFQISLDVVILLVDAPNLAMISLPF